jgi:hypothetical protein
VFLQTASAEDAGLAASITSLALADARNLLLGAYNTSVTQLEVTNHIDSVMRAEGSDGTLSYPTVLMARDEVTWPYGKTNDDATHVINPAVEPIQTLRAGARVNGQCCDVARTYFFESATQEMLDAYEDVLETQMALMSEMAPGVEVSYLDEIVQLHLADYIARPDVQYSHTWGHGIGDFTIMDPILSNDTEPMTLSEGLILGIQIYLLFDAGWFVRLEDTCLITESGVEVLSTAPKLLEDVILLPNSTHVDVMTSVDGYAYGSLASVNATIDDSDNRTPSQVSFFDGICWTRMTSAGTESYVHAYALEHSHPSTVVTLVRVEFTEDCIYSSLELSADLEATYEDVLDPIVAVVVEGVTTQDTMTWIFSKMGADMIRLHFLKVYPPPGDQFLVKDIDGNVVAEYKWNLGAEAITPWIPGNVAFVEVTPQWMSVYGGVNHFYFEVNVLRIYDPEATSTSGTTTETTSSSLTTDGSTSSTMSDTHYAQGLDPLLLTGLASGALVLLAVFLRKKR